MDSPIFDSVESELGVVINHGRQDVEGVRRVWHGITEHLHHQHYNLPRNQKETPVSVITELETILGNAETKTAELYNDAKTAVETHLPAIKGIVSAVENDVFVKAYFGAGLAVPEHLVGLGLDFLSKLVQAGGGSAVAPAQPAPAAQPEPLPAQ